MLGTKISTLAFPMLVLWLGHSPAVAGLAVFVTVMPGMLLYFPAGVLVDKMSPRRVMFVSEILRGAVAISIVIALHAAGRNVNILFLILAMFAEEVLEMFNTLADRRYLSGLIEAEEADLRRSKQASIEARVHAATLAGRPAAPLLFTLGPLVPFLVDAASFIFSMAGLLMIGWKRRLRNVEPAKKKRTSRPARQAHGSGEVFRRVRGDHRIWLGGLLMAMTSMVSQALILIFLTEANSHPSSAFVIGIVLAASGLGGAAGSYCSKIVPGGSLERWLPIQLGFWFASFLILALAGGRSAWWCGCTMFVLSVTGAIGNVELATYLNKRFTNGMLGKISSLGYSMTIGACALGPVIGGFAVQSWGVGGAVDLLVCIITVMALVSLFMFREPWCEKQETLAAKGSVADSGITVDMDSLSAETMSAEAPVAPSKPPVTPQSPSAGQCDAQTSLARGIWIHMADAAVPCRQRAVILSSKESTRVDH